MRPFGTVFGTEGPLFFCRANAPPKYAAGSHVDRTVPSPAAMGYAPNRAQVELKQGEISANMHETVTYFPALMNYTVLHYQQNIGGDRYSLWKTGTRQGHTGSAIAGNLA